MLVLSRTPDERIVIPTSDGLIIIMLVSIYPSGHAARIGIEAPGHVSIHREEVYRAIQEQGIVLTLKEATAELDALTAEYLQHARKLRAQIRVLEDEEGVVKATDGGPGNDFEVAEEPKT